MPANPAQVVKELCGIQAQYAPAAALALRVREHGLTAAAVEHARLQERSLVRTWGQRGTLHLLASDDLPWLLALLGPFFVQGGRRRRAELGLDEDTSVKGVRLLRQALVAKGPLTRTEIAAEVAPYHIPTEGQAAIHLIQRAALEGVLCLGADRDGEPTYVLLNDWLNLDRALSPADPLAELTCRYLAAYGPAAPEDLAHWSGLPISQARSAWQLIADQLLEVTVAGRPAWMLKTQESWLEQPPAISPLVRLLPAYDTYLLGYRHRDLALSPQHARRIHPGGGVLRPALMVDGRIVGAWRTKPHRRYLEVIVEPFEALMPDIEAGLEAEAAEVGRFLGTEVVLTVG